MTRLTRRLGAVVAAAAAAVALAPSTAHAAVSPGCTAKQSTWIGGTLTGYPDNRALDAHIGVSVGYKDSAGRLHVVLPDGSPNPSTVGDYSWVEHLNPTVAATGTDDPAADRTWGMCVWGGVTVWYAEVYPKAKCVACTAEGIAGQRTDKSRYGSTAYYAGTASAGQTVNVALRAPVTWQAAGGPTGGLQGYITHAGKPVPASALTRSPGRIRAFPGAGAACGVEGYSAAADQLATSADGLRTYYRLDYLAGGRCGAASQAYSFQVSAVIGGVTRSYARQVSVTAGRWPRIDVAIP